MAKQYFASDYAYGINPDCPALEIIVGFTGTGSQSCTVASGVVTFKDTYGQNSFSPLATNAPVNVGGGATLDSSITPSSVTLNSPNPPQATFAASFTYAHGNGTYVQSATCGLQEALNAASNVKGGCVVVDGRWAQLGGTTSMITSANNGSGSNQTFILDLRGTSFNQYNWSGAAWVSAGGAVAWAGAGNGLSFVPFVTTELVTLSTVGAVTQTSGNLLPANSLILAVTGTITVSITGTVTNWQLGDSGAAGRFSAVDTTLTAFESVPKASFPPVQIGTGVASATAGVYQAAAAKVYITTTGGGNPTAGKIRVTVYGFTLVNATS